MPDPFKKLELVIPERQGSNLALVTELEKTFMPLYEKGADLMRQASLVQVTDASQKGHMDTAETLLKQFRTLRSEVTAAHKTVKDDYLKGGRMCDAVKRIFMDGIGPAEDYLNEQKNFAIRQEQERLAKLREERLLALQPFTDLIPAPASDVALLSGEDWENLLAGVQVRHQREKERRAQEAADRMKKEADDALALQKAQREADELREQQRLAQEKLAEQQRAQQAAMQQQRDEQQRLANLRSQRSMALREVQALDMIPEECDDLAAMAVDDWAALIAAAQTRQREREQEKPQPAADPGTSKTVVVLGTIGVPSIAPMAALKGAEVCSIDDESMVNGIADALAAFIRELPAGMETEAGLACISKFTTHLRQAESWLRKQAPTLKPTKE